MIYTHSGVFHADDVFAVAAIAATSPERHEIVRTRDLPSTVEVEDWIIDVGMEYDPKRKRFDHHQPDAPVRENGIKYSAFGQIAEYFWGKESWYPYFLPFVMGIDARDNGQQELAASLKLADNGAWVGLYNPLYGSEEDFNTQFDEAVVLAMRMLVRAIGMAIASYSAEKEVRFAIESAKSGICVLERPAPWGAMVKQANAEGRGIRRMVYPNTTAGQWNVQQVPGADRLPETVDKVNGVVFVHPGRFMAVFKSKDAAIEAAMETEGSIEQKENATCCGYLDKLREAGMLR